MICRLKDASSKSFKTLSRNRFKDDANMYKTVQNNDFSSFVNKRFNTAFSNIKESRSRPDMNDITDLVQFYEIGNFVYNHIRNQFIK